MPSSLPCSKQIQETAVSDSNRCQDLVLQIVEYGTGSCESLENRTQEACALLSEAWENCLDLEDTLVSVFWLKSSVLASAENSISRKALIVILKALVALPNRINFWKKLQGNLHPSIVEEAGLGSENELLKKMKMHNTQVHYKQQKYNLLQEESEGYAKVLDFFLLQEPDDLVQRRSNLLQLIGTFELDPHRLLDVTLEVLELKLYPDGNIEEEAPQQPNVSFEIQRLLEIMQEFSLAKLHSLISFKLSPEEEASEASLGMIAFLAVNGLITLPDLVKGFLQPIENDIEEAHKVFLTKETKRIQGMTRISLSGEKKENPEIAKLSRELSHRLPSLKKKLLVRITSILLQWGEWSTAKPLFSQDVWSQLCTLMPETFGSCLCKITQTLLQPWTKANAGSPMLSASWQPKDLGAADSRSQMNLIVAVRTISDPLLLTVKSGCISCHPILFCRICRVLASILDSSEGDDVIDDGTYHFFKVFLVPSISLFPSNPALSTELWELLNLLPYATRYRLYNDWIGPGLENTRGALSSNTKPLPNLESEIRAGLAARYVLKRLSKDNVRDMSRQIAKVTHSNPLVVFTTILHQIESYDNMVEVMVEAQRYVNPLGLDVLGYCILSRLSGMTGGVNRSRLKADGVNVSQWLQSLEIFTGAFFKRFPFVELRGILCYLMRRLRDGHVMELGILRTLLKVPGGYSFADYSPAASLSTSQLEGLAGSITLKRETMSFGIVEEVNHRAADRLRSSLHADGFGVSMLVLISQVRSRLLFSSTRDTPKDVKLVGNLYDSCQVAMSTLLDFLIKHQEGEDEGREGKIGTSILRYAEYVPTIAELKTNFGFDIPSTWMLCRPILRAASLVDDSDTICDEFSLSQPSRDSYMSKLGDSIWSSMSPHLFEFFYCHNLQDIFCPSNTYKAEISRMKKEVERIQARPKTATPSSLNVGHGSPRNEAEEIGRLKSVSQKLDTDLSEQKRHVVSTVAKMQRKKADFGLFDAVPREAAKAFLVHCAFPRSTQSPSDAIYCAHFVSRLHSMEIPGFSTLHYIDELISVISGALFGVTEGEAANLAILLWETWKIVNNWRYDEDIFNSEVRGKPGSEMGSTKGIDGYMVYKDFVPLYNTWHATLGAALIGCLESSEYMHTRAGLVLLTRIVEVFPTRPKLGSKLFRALSPLQDENSSRPDIRASASAYGTMLTKARDEGKWVEEDASVAKARAEKEKAAAEERKRKIAQQFQEMKRDTEKITEEIGHREGRDRHDRRREPRDNGSGLGAVEADKKRSLQENTRSGKDEGRTRIESGEISARGTETDRRGGPFSRTASPSRRRSSPPKDSDRGRERDRATTDDRNPGRNESLGNLSGRKSDRQRGADSWRRDEEANDPSRGSRDEGSGGRWKRGDAAPQDGRGRSGKRGRPPSPDPAKDGRGDRAKRPRLEETRRDGGDSPPRSRPRRRGRR